MRHPYQPPNLLKALFLLAALSLAGPGVAARLVPDRTQVATGEQVTIKIEQARASATVKWRTSAELKLESKGAGMAKFKAQAPGRALVTATVDGELASTFVTVVQGTAPAVPAATSRAMASAAAVADMRAVPEAGAEQVTKAPYLRGMLPQDAVAYLRVPSIWGVLGAPKGNVFDKALRSAAYSDAVGNIRTGVIETLLPEMPPESQVVLQLLLGRIASPLEVVVTPSAKAGAGMPDVLATANVNAADPQAINDLFTELAGQGPGLELKIPLDADGAGMLTVEGLPLQLYFDSGTQRLYLYFADPGAEPDPVAQRVAALQPQSDHSMYASEQAIDSTGQGLFLWVDPNSLMQIMERMGQAEQVAMLRAFGGSEAKSLALGMGSSGGKERIKVLLDMPQVGFRSFVPAVDTDLPFKTAGAPDVVIMLGLPGPDDLALIEGNVLGMMGPQEAEEYQAVKGQIKETLGFGLEDLLGAFGDELLVVFDRAGQYVAVRLRNPDAYQNILKQLVQRFSLQYETREVQGQTYHHLLVPPLDPEIQQKLASGDMDPLGRRLAGIPSHLYWTQEGDYLLFASVPQILVDYRYVGEKVPLGDWMRQSQGVEPKGALLLATARSRGTPRMMYVVNLWMLTWLGDLVGRPVDLFAIPTPMELQLPDAGAYSLQIASSPDQLSIELVYESNPLELIMAMGGVQTAIAGGIAAAIAVPAYTDYQTKAKVAEALASIQQLEYEVIAFHIDKQRFPSEAEAAELLSGVTLPGNLDVGLEPDTGAITVEFYLEGLEGGASLVLTPEDSGAGLDWVCNGTLDRKFLQNSNVCTR